jgi:hypothetical protein
MKYVCTEDIENMAAQGKKELVLDENTVLMDLARDAARQLGIEIIDGTRPAPPKAASPAAPSSPAKAPSPAAPAPSSPAAASKPAARPKGCQHGPMAPTARKEQSNSHQKSDGVVDQLVELVRQSAGKRPGN